MIYGSNGVIASIFFIEKPNFTFPDHLAWTEAVPEMHVLHKFILRNAPFMAGGIPQNIAVRRTRNE